MGTYNIIPFHIIFQNSLLFAITTAATHFLELVVRMGVCNLADNVKGYK